MPNLVPYFSVPSTASNAAFGTVAFAPGTKLVRFSVFNNTAGTQFIQLYDASSSVSTAFQTLTPWEVYPVASFSTVAQAFQVDQYAKSFSKGIVVAVSSVASSYASAPASQLIAIDYL